MNGDEVKQYKNHEQSRECDQKSIIYHFSYFKTYVANLKEIKTCFFKRSVGTLVSIPATGCCQCQKFTWMQTRPFHTSKLHQELLNTLVTISASGIFTLCILKQKEFVREKAHKLLFSYSSVCHSALLRWDPGLYPAVKSSNSYVSSLQFHFLQLSFFSLCLMLFLSLSSVFPSIGLCSLPA